VLEYENFHQCQRGILLDIWLLLMSTLEESPKQGWKHLEVMSVFGEV
jgi:hypothetical protein